MFKEAGLNSPVLGSIIMGCVNLAGTLAAVALMDRAGRRLLILLSHAGMAACLILIAVVSFIPGQPRNHLASAAERHASLVMNWTAVNQTHFLLTMLPQKESSLSDKKSVALELERCSTPILVEV